MKKIDWSKWSAIAEIFGAIAIVISLIFVGIQIKQNTAATYAASYDRLLSDHMSLSIAEANNPEMLAASNYFVASDLPDSENDLQYQQGRASWMTVGRIYERAYFAHQYHQLGQEEWGRYQRQMCGGIFQELIPKLTPRDGPLMFSAGFWDYVQNCEVEP